MKNISRIISIIFLSFSILLLCYVFYRSEVFHIETLSGYYLKYYVIAFLFIILSFVSFFIPNNETGYQLVAETIFRKINELEK